MEKNYDHLGSEDKIYAQWEASGLMRADETSDKPPFVIALPPPNVTGQLHLGHAAMLAIEDVLIRFKRMTGHESLWIPGTDHAAIATENVVIKHLGIKSREELSREQFMDEARKFAADSHDTIVNQTKKMGAWLDWSREVYTFDEARNFAVNTIFKQLYDDGLIVRGHRMINWSTGAQSVIADDELEWEDRVESFYYLKCGEFIIGTARAETKCSDSPVIVNPHGTYVRVKAEGGSKKGETLVLSKHAWEKDKVFENLRKNYEVAEEVTGRDLVGQKFEYETYAGMRKFWVIADNVIDMEKGTGAMTISASHSEDDYELATRLDLKELFFTKIDLNGKMTDIAGPCEGMEIEVARKESAKIMAEKNLLVAENKNYSHRVPLCYRSNCVIEPMVSQQWFVAVDKEYTDKWTGEKTTLKKITQDAVRDSHVKIIPDRFNKTYFHWIDNLRDWCISRQIWWGHRIPVWYDEAGNVHLPREQKIILARHGETNAGKNKIVQGFSDVLTEKGKAQSGELAEFLKNKGITKIISSAHLRAKETAEVVAQKLNLDIEFWEEFNGIDFGDIAGMPQIPGKLAIERSTEAGTGENTRQVFKRVEKGWERLKQEESDGKILVVAHRSILSALEAVRNGKNETTFLDNRRKNENADFGYWGEITVLQDPKGDNLTQDEDTLDTWFSSALWPFSPLGWPSCAEASEGGPNDFNKFYPSHVLETGHDIIFFWVARMIMFGRYATGKYPFHTTYLHGLVCDEHGKKMSKSKGNGIDPLDVIEKFGADPVRLSLVIGSSPGNPIPLGEAKISGYRNFVNKLWNAGRFAAMQNSKFKIQNSKKSPPKSLADRWIYHRFSQVSREVTEHLEKYEISAAGDQIYHFVWGEFCDWYLEVQKAEPNAEFLAWIYMEILTLVHPLCPFITEKLYQIFWGEAESLMNREYPKIDFKDTEAVNLFTKVQEIVTEIRKVRTEKGLNPKDKIVAKISTGTVDSRLIANLQDAVEIIKTLANLSDCEIAEKCEKPDNAAVVLAVGMEIFVEIPFDAGAEKTRLEKEITELQKKIGMLEGRLSNKSYVDKAPEALVTQTKGELESSKNELAKLEEELGKL